YKGDIEADMDAYLKQTFGQTVAEYKASTLESNKYAHVYAKLTEGVAAQEGTAQAQYEKDLQAQKEAFAESADEYRSAITRNSMGDYILYKPAGYAVVKQILLGYEDEDGNAYDDLSLAKNEAEEELIEAEQKVKTTEVALETAEEELLDAQAALDALGKEADVNTVNAAQSTLNTAKANVASLKQELQEAQALHALTKKNAEEAIKAHTEGINSIIAKYQDKIDAIMNGYHNGVPFETLIDQYNEDPGLEGGSDFAVLGYTIIPGDQTYYPEFSEAALKLTKQGQISDPIVTESGVHILYAMYDIDKAADVPFAVAEPIVKAAADVAAQEEKFNSVIAEYMKEWNVKTWSKRMKFVK
ncbi:MAG: peptidylprolyl isomerase, partial [Clostridia bacterium]|nr:peptidylprolyl isomerase [Clostridia bacterium]